MNNKDRVVIITGGAAGLGKATAERLAEEGAKLCLVDLNEEALIATKEEIKDSYPELDIIAVKADCSDEDQVKNYIDKTMEEYGRIDGFFNNAGVEGKQNLTEDYGSDEFRWVLDVNLNGVFYGMKHVLKVMKEQGQGSIVNCASVGGIRGVGNQSGYSASKHGVVGLTKNSAIEYGQYGVNINAVAPGAIMTDMVRESLKQMDPENPEKAGEEFVSVNPMRRFGKVEELAALVSFLLSPDSSFINAQTIAIDGGQSMAY